MTLLLGAIGWGLITVGAVTHLWHPHDLRRLLGAHVDRERPLALALVATESTVAVAIAVGVVAGASWTAWPAFAGTALGLGFCGWIARLLATGSELPCACSFSSGPTTPWSLLRAAFVVPVGLLARSFDATASESVVALGTGFALAAAIHVLPEALSWPTVTRAQLARLDSHAGDNAR